jgi:REP element-mobilizing transposase RayT
MTTRLEDSIPRSLMTRLERETKRAIAPLGLNGDEYEDRYDRALRRKVEKTLDRGLGSCPFRRNEVASALDQILQNRDGVDYELISRTIMPNHLHVVFQLFEKPLSDVVEAWKSVSAREINRLIGKKGKLWQDDYYDTLMRDEAHLKNAIDYTMKNPAKSGLMNWPWATVYDKAVRRIFGEAPRSVDAQVRPDGRVAKM